MFESSPVNPRTFDPLEDYDLNQHPDVDGSNSDAQDDDFQVAVAEESDDSEQVDLMQVDKDLLSLQETEKRRNTFPEISTPSQRPYPNLEATELKLTHGNYGIMPSIANQVVPVTSISEAMNVIHGAKPIAPKLEAMRLDQSNLKLYETGPVRIPPVPTAKTLGYLGKEWSESTPAPIPSIPTATSRHHPSRTSPKPSRPLFLSPSLQGPISKPEPSSHLSTDRTPIRGEVHFPPRTDLVICLACSKEHTPGHCPLRNVKIQRCPGCGLAHLHLNRTCPLLQKPEYVEMIHKRLRESTEDTEILKTAKLYISGVRSDWMLRQARGRNPKIEKK